MVVTAFNLIVLFVFMVLRDLKLCTKLTSELLRYTSTVCSTICLRCRVNKPCFPHVHKTPALICDLPEINRCKKATVFQQFQNF